MLQDRSTQLERLVLVELTLIEENAKVLQQWRGAASLRWNLLETLNGLWSAEDALKPTTDYH